MYDMSELKRWITKYILYLEANKLLEKKFKPIEYNQKRIMLSLINFPDKFKYDERFRVFISPRGCILHSYLILGILKAAGEDELYLEIQDKTY